MRDLSTLYNGAVTGVFPDVKAKPASTETAFDGTPWLDINIDDTILGWLQALLTLNGDTPDGQPELKDDSQILDNMRQMAAYKELKTVAASGALVFGKKSFSVELDTTGGNLAISALPLPDFRGQTVDFVVRGSGNATIAAGNGITFDQVIRAEKGRSVVAVEVSGALQWELSVDEKRICKAWANYNQTTPAILDEYNVSSVTDNSTGNFTVNFINAMNDTDYIAVSGVEAADGASNTVTNKLTGGIYTVNAMQFITQNSIGTNVDATNNMILFFGS